MTRIGRGLGPVRIRETLCDFGAHLETLRPDMGTDVGVEPNGIARIGLREHPNRFRSDSRDGTTPPRMDDRKAARGGHDGAQRAIRAVEQGNDVRHADKDAIGALRCLILLAVHLFRLPDVHDVVAMNLVGHDDLAPFGADSLKHYLPVAQHACQIVDESMGDTVRITVIATGFSADAFGGNQKRDYSRKDLFAPTAQDSAGSASSTLSASSLPSPMTSSPAAAPRMATTSANRFADEDYIPDFLKRR